MYYVYILQSLKDYRTYTGYTENVFKRLREHNSGKVRATKNRKPFILLYIENCVTPVGVKRREMYWKNGGGRRRLKKYFLHGFPPIPKEWARLAHH